ncbi:MAG: MFS transporter [Casimicrobiaceae bacterium]
MAPVADATSLRDTSLALAVTLGIQIFVALAATATAVLAPVIGPDLHVAPRLVGVFVGLVYAGSMLASLSGGHFIERFGPIRLSQIGVLICAAGVLVVAITTPAWIGLLILAAIVIGLGYGPITPASSHVLARTTPLSRLALTFSIKQTGVPAGAAVAGAALPAMAGSVGWRATLLSIAVLGVVIAVAAQSTRSRLDGKTATASRPFSFAVLFAPLRTLFRHRGLIELSIAGFVYASMQMCLMSFLVVYLTESLAFALVASGFALTAANLGGIVGRIGWGAVADRWIAPRRMLGILGLAAAGCSYLVANFSATWPSAVLLGVCAVFGATAIGWNGVQLSEVARQAPEGQAGTITGASGFVTFAGVVLGPPLFALLASLSGSYRVGFAVFGTASLVCGSTLLLRKAPTPRP